MAATFRPKGLFFWIYKFKFYPKIDFLIFHVFLCDLENEQKKFFFLKKRRENLKKTTTKD